MLGKKFHFDEANKEFIADPDKIKMALAVINGIVCFVNDVGWREGYRNNIAVDLCCACYILNEDPVALVTNLDCWTNTNDTDDLKERCWAIGKYIDEWSYDIEHYMLNIDEWEKWNDSLEQQDRYYINDLD